MDDGAPADVGAYAEDQAKLKAFLENFQEDNMDGVPTFKYLDALQRIVNRRSKMLEVELDDVHEHLDQHPTVPT